MLKNHVFTTICPQKTIQKPRSAHQNVRNALEKRDFTPPEKILPPIAATAQQAHTPGTLSVTR
jgi:hypothetical protein